MANATPENADGKPKVWTVGTLSYASGGIIILFFWLLWGDFSWSMRDRSVGPMAQWYLNDIKVPNLLFGLLMSSFPALAGLILGPIISVKSDRHRGRWGRRIPFLLVTTPIAALGMIGLAFTPVMARWLHSLGQPGHPLGSRLHEALGGSVAGARVLSLVENEMVVSLVCFGVFWAAFEFATIAGQSVFGGLINDVVPKELLGRFYGLFRAVSLIDGMIFNFWIMGHVPTHFTIIMTVIGIFYVLSFMWVCFKVKEGKYPPPPPPEPGSNTWLGGFAGGAKMYLRECFTKSYYLWVFVMLMAAAVSFLPINVFAIPYAKSLELSMDTYGKFLALTYLISLCLAYPLGWLADRFHPLSVSIGSLTGYVIVTAWGFAYATNQTTFLIAWILHGVLSGTYFTSAASIGQRLYPHEKFAQFASAASILAAPVNMAVAPLVGWVVDWGHNDYRYTFAGGCLLSSFALFAAFKVHSRFMKLGGPKGYVAP
jgi:MFS family permease